MKMIKDLSGTYFVNIAVPSRALVWDLLAILPCDWSYTGRRMALSPRVTEALQIIDRK